LTDERRVRLSSFIEAGVRRFTYLYDFGDGWEHVVKIEDLVAPRPGLPPIVCLAGANACPPEDVGGPHGYAEFLAILADPNHEEHADVGGRLVRSVGVRSGGDEPSLENDQVLIVKAASARRLPPGGMPTLR
jgi:hypothetical protein